MFAIQSTLYVVTFAEWIISFQFEKKSSNSLDEDGKYALIAQLLFDFYCGLPEGLRTKMFLENGARIFRLILI